MTKELREHIAKHDHGPKQRNPYPMTTQEEIGWFAEDRGTEQFKRTQLHHKPLGSSTVTQVRASGAGRGGGASEADTQ